MRIEIVESLSNLAKALGEYRGAATWAYCRVSSDKQEAEGLSLQAQTAAIEKYCQEQNIPHCVVVHEVRSAAKPCFTLQIGNTTTVSEEEETTAYRPLFSLLMSALTNGEHDLSTLIVWKLDRLSRVLYEQEFVFELLQRRKIALVSLTAGESDFLQSNDPSRQLIRQIFGALAQYERALIKMRLDAGIRTKAALGGWLGGRVPFGYRVEKGDLVIVEKDAAIVRKIFEYRDIQQLPYHEIAVKLAQETNEHWYRVRVRRVVLNRLLYSGIYQDRFGAEHARPDLRILTDAWDERGQWKGVLS